VIFPFESEKVGLPTTLADIGLDPGDRSRLRVVVEKACAPVEYIHHEAGKITPDKVFRPFGRPMPLGCAGKRV
jgi:glycerol dehydrogenase